MFFKLVSIGLVMALVGCGNLPRGAGLQREVLKQGSAVDPALSAVEQDVPTDFAVETITKDSLSRYSSWPAVGRGQLGWLKRVEQPNSRIIAPGDSVALSVWVTEDNGLLTAPGQRFVTFPAMQVSSSGQVFLPYIGSQKISGMSPEHARSAIEKAYTAVTPSAQVQLSLTEGRESTVSVVSGVGNPGPYPLRDQDVTLLDILAAAGGPDQAFKNPQIRLQRGNRTYGMGMDRLSEDTSLNTTLRGGDRILVEEDDRYFLSLGAAGSKAQHRFPQDDVSALDALSIIGGLASERANAQGILVLRSYPASAVRRDGSGPRHVRTIFTLDLTSADGLFSAGAFAIQPGDLIYVTESPLVGTRNVFGLIGSAFGLAGRAENL
jgi:polysaccharide export outer membrane protein